jgi:hypothetical protein
MTTAQYVDEQDRTIAVADDNGERFVPADPNNKDYQALLASGVTIAPCTPTSPNAGDVRAEASRRMQVLVGARDAAHLEIIIANATREAVRLLRKGPANWTPAETERGAELEAVDQAIDAIRAASNLIEGDPPADYADDSHWP